MSCEMPKSKEPFSAHFMFPRIAIAMHEARYKYKNLADRRIIYPCSFGVPFRIYEPDFVHHEG